MCNPFPRFLRIALLAAIGVLTIASTSQAQVGVQFGGRTGNDGRWGVSIGQPYYGGYGGYYGGYPYGYGYGGYTGYAYPMYSGYYPSYSYGPYYNSGYIGPMYYPSQTYTSPGYQSNYYSPESYTGMQDDNSATLEVHVPARAELTFDGQKTQQSGPVRIFTTPVLTDGKTYSYEVRATWSDNNGKQVTRSRTVHVAPRQHSVVNFMDGGTTIDQGVQGTPSGLPQPTPDKKLPKDK
jgi:uncharacterized protein (TIGR03000 family)